MSITQQSRISRTFARLRQIWADLDYAQRRMLEIQTGSSGHMRSARSTSEAILAELESLYELDYHKDERSL